MRVLISILCVALAGASALYAGEGEGGAEQALVSFSDAKSGLTIGHPGSWSRDPSFVQGIRFAGGDDAMTAIVLALSPGSDVRSFAEADSLAKEFPGFKRLSLKASKEIRGAWIAGFEAQGISAVTGKGYKAHDERYYIPINGNRIGIVTITGPFSHYDREGVRDIAMTFSAN